MAKINDLKVNEPAEAVAGGIAEDRDSPGD